MEVESNPYAKENLACALETKPRPPVTDDMYTAYPDESGYECNLCEFTVKSTLFSAITTHIR